MAVSQKNRDQRSQMCIKNTYNNNKINTLAHHLPLHFIPSHLSQGRKITVCPAYTSYL